MPIFKPFLIEFGVTRCDSEKTITDLLRFLTEAPEDSFLRRHIAVEELHTEAFPRPRMRKLAPGRFSLVSVVYSDEAAESVFVALEQIFANNGWRLVAPF